MPKVILKKQVKEEPKINKPERKKDRIPIERCFEEPPFHLEVFLSSLKGSKIGMVLKNGDIIEGTYKRNIVGFFHLKDAKSSKIDSKIFKWFLVERSHASQIYPLEDTE